MQNCHWAWGRKSGFGNLLRSTPMWLHSLPSLSGPRLQWKDLELNCSVLVLICVTVTPAEYCQATLKIHVRRQCVSLFSRHQDTLKHPCFKALWLCLNVSTVRNPTEINGTLSTGRNLFCDSFLNVIPNPCSLHTFSFSITIKGNFSCWQIPYNFTQQSLFWKLVSQNSQSSLRAPSWVIKKPAHTEVSFL